MKLTKKNIKKILLPIVKFSTFALIGLFAILVGLFFYYTWDLPRPEKFTESPFIQSTKIYDRTGRILLYDIYGEEKREIVPFHQISDNLKRAILSSEDARFYQHGGVDLRALVRAILADLRLRSPSQGGSTITQQLIRSVYLTNQKNLARKVREVVLSMEIEKRYSKDQIFEWYLNKIPFGQNTYGVQAASQTYFNKSSSDLTIGQSATLAALIPAPSYYSPYGSHKKELLSRKDYILGRMKELGYINDEEYKTAKEEEIAFSDILTPIKAPHFVMYVKQYLEEKYGEDALKEKGFKVYTTLDWPVQEYAEQVVQGAEKTNMQYNANNTAMVIINPNNGEILSLIGSKDFFSKSYPKGCDQKASGSCLFDPKYDVAAIGLRQPGSALKPFVYATAFAKGYTPDTQLWDIKTEFNKNCATDGSQEKDQYGLDCYHPQNYDGQHRGLVSLRNSLAGSLNIPSVELLYLVGLNDSLKTAQNFGITTLNEPDRYGLSLVLGGGEVNLLELTSAYGVFATEGKKTPRVSILKIEDRDGNVVEKNDKEPTKVIDTQVARQINSILSDNKARAPIFGENNALYFENYDVAAKTGTTQYFNDAWTVGYNPSFAVGVWVGNNDNSSINKKTGIGLAAPIWRKVMEKLLTSNAPETFTKPNPISNTNPVLLGQFPAGDPPHSILHYINKESPLGPPPQNPADDSLYQSWEDAVRIWINFLNPAPPQSLPPDQPPPFFP